MGQRIGRAAFRFDIPEQQNKLHVSCMHCTTLQEFSVLQNCSVGNAEVVSHAHLASTPNHNGDGDPHINKHFEFTCKLAKVIHIPIEWQDPITVDKIHVPSVAAMRLAYTKPPSESTHCCKIALWDKPGLFHISFSQAHQLTMVMVIHILINVATPQSGYRLNF